MVKKEELVQYYIDCDNSYQHWGEHELYEMHYGYWDKNIKNHGDSLLKMNQFLCEKMKIKDGDKILDAGCGVGSMSFWLAKQYNNINVIGINISKLQIDKANAFAKKYKFENRVSFLERDYLNSGFENNTFDIVFAAESVCHSENKNNFIKEACRILKPNGKLIINDYFLIKENLNKIDRKAMCLYLNGWMIPNLASKNKFFENLKNNGFRNIQCWDITDNIAPSAKNMFVRGCIGLFADKLFKRKNKVQFANTITCFFQYITLKMGLWRYLIFYAEK